MTSTTTTTTTTTATAARNGNGNDTTPVTPHAIDKVAIQSKSKNPMNSTWLTSDPANWHWSQRLLNWVGAVQFLPDMELPKFDASHPVPYFPIWKQWAWCLPRILPAIAINYAVVKTFGSFHPIPAFLFYGGYFLWFALQTLSLLQRMSIKHGVFDGDKARDGIPDLTSDKVFWSLISTVTVRPLFAVFFAYDRTEVPSINPWALIFQVAIYATVLDFWFYWYHRAMHEVPWLWRLHRLHHTTKHPQAALAPFADTIQEIGDILVIPLMTYASVSYLFEVNFATWWVATSMILFTEAMGHSGIRLYWPVPTTGLFLQPFDADLALEDHDIHHRSGWKKAKNYGKQTRLWDVVFGTSGQRVEGHLKNIDYSVKVSPWE